jgi:hypothetical protein
MAKCALVHAFERGILVAGRKIPRSEGLAAGGRFGRHFCVPEAGRALPACKDVNVMTVPSGAMTNPANVLRSPPRAEDGLKRGLHGIPLILYERFAVRLTAAAVYLVDVIVFGVWQIVLIIVFHLLGKLRHIVGLAHGCFVFTLCLIVGVIVLG